MIKIIFFSVSLGAGFIGMILMYKFLKEPDPFTVHIRKKMDKYWAEEKQKKLDEKKERQRIADEKWLKNPKRFTKRELHDREIAAGHYERYLRSRDDQKNN